MELSANQKLQFRKVIELSTFLQDSRASVNRRWHEVRERLDEAKRQQTKTTENLNRIFVRPEDRQLAQETLADKNKKLQEKINDLTGVFDRLTQQLEDMHPDVACASNLSARLLDFGGIDGDKFEMTTRFASEGPRGD